MSGIPWSAGDLARLRKLYPAYIRKEITRADLCRALGRSLEGIGRQASRQGLSGKAYSVADEEFCRKLVKNLKL